MKISEKIFLGFLTVVFLLLIAFQGYLFIFPDVQKEAKAQRLGGEIAPFPDPHQAVDKEEEGLFTFLTFETEEGKASAATLLINHTPVGDFQGGVLSLKVNSGDEISVVGGVQGDVIRLLDPPDILDDDFPQSLAIGGGEKFWGTVEFK